MVSTGTYSLPSRLALRFMPDDCYDSLVINSISTMEPSRKAWRLVGGVLIQQSVGEVLPAVTTHQSMVMPSMSFVSIVVGILS